MRTWSREVFNKACEVFCLNTPDLNGLDQSASNVFVTNPAKYNKVVQAEQEAENKNICENLSDQHKQDVKELVTKSVSMLTGEEARYMIYSIFLFISDLT